MRLLTVAITFRFSRELEGAAFIRLLRCVINNSTRHNHCKIIFTNFIKITIKSEKTVSDNNLFDWTRSYTRSKMKYECELQTKIAELIADLDIRGPQGRP